MIQLSKNAIVLTNKRDRLAQMPSKSKPFIFGLQHGQVNITIETFQHTNLYYILRPQPFNFISNFPTESICHLTLTSSPFSLNLTVKPKPKPNPKPKCKIPKITPKMMEKQKIKIMFQGDQRIHVHVFPRCKK